MHMHKREVITAFLGLFLAHGSKAELLQSSSAQEFNMKAELLRILDCDSDEAKKIFVLNSLNKIVSNRDFLISLLNNQNISKEDFSKLMELNLTDEFLLMKNKIQIERSNPDVICGETRSTGD